MALEVALIAIQTFLALWVFLLARSRVELTGCEYILGMRPFLWLFISVIPGLGMVAISIYYFFGRRQKIKIPRNQIVIQRPKKALNIQNIGVALVAFTFGIVLFTPKSQEKTLLYAFEKCEVEYEKASKKIEKDFYALVEMSSFDQLQFLYRLERKIETQRALSLESCHSLARISVDQYNDKEMARSFKAKAKYFVYLYDFYETKSRSLAVNTYRELLGDRKKDDSFASMLGFLNNKVLVSQELTLYTGRDLLKFKRYLSQDSIAQIKTIIRQNNKYRRYAGLLRNRLMKARSSSGSLTPLRSISSQE